MTIKLRVLLCAVAGAQFLGATPLPACAAGTLASYISVGTCLLGANLTVYNFSLQTTGGVPLPADASLITVTPDQTGMGLTFSSSSLFQVTGTQSESFVLTYSVDPTGPIINVQEGMPKDPNRVSPAQLSIGSTISLGADFTAIGCPPATPCTGINLFNNDSGSTLTGSVSFAPVSIVGIQDIIQLQAGGGAIALPSLDNTFSTVTPEPHSGLLCVVGAFGIFGWRGLMRRRSPGAPRSNGDVQDPSQ